MDNGKKNKKQSTPQVQFGISCGHSDLYKPDEIRRENDRNVMKATRKMRAIVQTKKI